MYLRLYAVLCSSLGLYSPSVSETFLKQWVLVTAVVPSSSNRGLSSSSPGGSKLSVMLASVTDRASTMPPSMLGIFDGLCHPSGDFPSFTDYSASAVSGVSFSELWFVENYIVERDPLIGVLFRFREISVGFLGEACES